MTQFKEPNADEKLFNLKEQCVKYERSVSI